MPVCLSETFCETSIAIFENALNQQHLLYNFFSDNFFILIDIVIVHNKWNLTFKLTDFLI